MPNLNYEIIFSVKKKIEPNSTVISALLKFLFADALKSGACLLDIFSYEKHHSVSFCMGCKTLVTCRVEKKSAGWAFTQKLYLSTISSHILPDVNVSRTQFKVQQN